MGTEFYEGWTKEQWIEYCKIHDLHYVALVGLKSMIKYIEANEGTTISEIEKNIGNYDDAHDCALEYVETLIRDGQITVDNDGIISLI